MTDAWIVHSHRGRFDFPPVWFSTAAPFVPQCDVNDDESIIAAITALLRFDRYVARDYSPGYSPLVIIDETIWNRVQRRFRWVPPERVKPVKPATDGDLLAFAMDALANVPDMRRRMRSLRASVSDAWQRPIVPVFVQAAEWSRGASELTPFVWASRARLAATQWIEKDYPELVPLLRGLPPAGSRVFQDIYSLRTKLAKNYRRAGCPKTKDYRSLVTLLRHLERIGVFKMGSKRRYRWGRVWKSGLTESVVQV